MRTSLIALALIAVVGCGPRVEVKSTTTWDGAISNSDGAVHSVGPYTGNHTFEGSDCGTFQKQTENGMLTARVVYKGLIPRSGEEASTSTAYGVVSVCGEK